MLINYKADTAALDKDNLTPIHQACKNGHVDTVERHPNVNLSLYQLRVCRNKASVNYHYLST
jgi:hypothetical protein